MNKLIIFITLFVTGFLTAQIKENRELADFSKLKASSSVAVFYTISNVKSVVVETDDAEKMQYIKTEVVGETLNVYLDTSKNSNTKKSRKRKWNNNINFKVLKITISGPSLNAIKASSSAFVKLENLNTSDNLDIAVSSSGSIKGNFECKNLNIDAASSGGFVANVSARSVVVESSSSSMVNLEGKAVALNVKASSSGTCNLKEFKVENAVVLVSSSASVSVYTSKSLEANASSSASVSFYGNPTNVSKEMSSSGSISKK